MKFKEGGTPILRIQRAAHWKRKAPTNGLNLLFKKILRVPVTAENKPTIKKSPEEFKP